MSPDGTGAQADAAAIESMAADPQADPTTQAAATGADTPISEGQPAGDGAPSDATTATAEDDADLASYPENIREHFRALPPEVRKSLYGHAEANAKEGLKAVQAREAEIAEKQAAEEARRAAVRAKVGKYVGDEPVTKVGRDGIERVLPTLEETMRLNQNRRGRDELWQKYSLDEDGIEDHLDNLNERRDMLDGATDLLEDRALARIDGRMRDKFREAGLDPALLDQANAPEEIVPTVVRYLTSKHAAEIKAQKDEYEGRIDATNVNAEGLRGRVLAATSRTPATGGRSGGGSTTTLERLKQEAGSIEEFSRRAAAGEYSGIDLSK